MRNKLLRICLAALLINGCTPAKFWRKYVVFNNTGSTIVNLTISDLGQGKKSWNETLPEQGWVLSGRYRHNPLVVSWTDETGSHEAQFIETRTKNRLNAEFYIELNPHGELTGRMIEPPPEDRNVWAYIALIPLYLLYCLVVVLVVGVPLALAITLGYGLFQGIRTGSVSLVKGFSGDNTVFQFTIREVLMLMTVVCLALGWFLTLMRP